MCTKSIFLVCFHKNSSGFLFRKYNVIHILAINLDEKHFFNFNKKFSKVIDQTKIFFCCIRKIIVKKIRPLSFLFVEINRKNFDFSETLKIANLIFLLLGLNRSRSLCSESAKSIEYEYKPIHLYSIYIVFTANFEHFGVKKLIIRVFTNI